MYRNKIKKQWKDREIECHMSNTDNERKNFCFCFFVCCCCSWDFVVVVDIDALIVKWIIPYWIHFFSLNRKFGNTELECKDVCIPKWNVSNVWSNVWWFFFCWISKSCEYQIEPATFFSISFFLFLLWIFFLSLLLLSIRSLQKAPKTTYFQFYFHIFLLSKFVMRFQITTYNVGINFFPFWWIVITEKKEKKQSEQHTNIKISFFERFSKKNCPYIFHRYWMIFDVIWMISQCVTIIIDNIQKKSLVFFWIIIIIIIIIVMIIYFVEKQQQKNIFHSAEWM